jgi:hypothetical protein
VRSVGPIASGGQFTIGVFGTMSHEAAPTLNDKLNGEAEVPPLYPIPVSPSCAAMLHPRLQWVKLANAFGRSDANVSRNQDVYPETQTGQPAQNSGAYQGAS